MMHRLPVAGELRNAVVPQGDASREVTVIGAGIVGVCCALYLQREGFAVTVVDREAPGEGCSKGNAGIFGAASCVPLAMPGAARRLPRTLLSSCSSPSVRLHHLPKAAPWLLRFLLSSRRRRAEAIARALRSLQRSLFDAYAPLLEDAGAEAMVQRSGKLHVYESRQAFERDALERDIQRRNGVEVLELTGEQARELEPALAPDVTNAAYFPQVAHCIDPFRLVQTLVRHFLRTGGRLVRGTVKAFELGGNGPRRLVTESGGMDVETLVIAAGAWSRPLVAELGTKVPLESERGYHTMLPRPGVSMRIPIKAGGRGVVLTPMEAGLRIAGIGELAGVTKPADYSCADRLVAVAESLVPGLSMEGATYWMGHRPAMPDSLPVVGRSPRYRNVYFAFGHGHVGLALAAITAKLVAELASGRPTSVDITPFAPDRFHWSGAATIKE